MSVSFEQVKSQILYSQRIWNQMTVDQKMRVTKTQSEEQASNKFKSANAAEKFRYTREYQW